MITHQGEMTEWQRVWLQRSKDKKIREVSLSSVGFTLVVDSKWEGGRNARGGGKDGGSLRARRYWYSDRQDEDEIPWKRGKGLSGECKKIKHGGDYYADR